MRSGGKKSQREGRGHGGVLLIVLLWYLWPAVLAGQIYQYQDEFGNWNFTDDPPEEYESSIVPDIATSYNSSRNRDPDHDLVTHLESAYEPSTPIAYATLAVVSIRTDSVEGSGFFCSDDGHILTSKHVVRPEASEGLAGRQRELAEREQKLKAIDGDLKESRDQLRLMNQDLEGYEGLIADTRDAETRAWAEDAHARLSQRYRSEKGKISAMEKSVRTLGSDLRRTSRELGSAQGFAMSETRFEIILKDGTELVADLLEVSDDQDLALLKLDGYRTPFLNMDPSQQLSQGVRVFAIGNPLGMQDAVTSGVVTQITPEYLLTDTQILPGSSGGPLILESGEVIGINVSRQVAAGTSKYAAGFGKVIPIALALQSFPDELSSSGLQDLDAVQSGHAGPDQAQTLEPHWTESLRVEPHAGPALDRLGAFGRGDDATSDATPVRLIVPDQEESQDPDTAPQLESRSLDFPPVGGGIIPSGISRPRE